MAQTLDQTSFTRGEPSATPWKDYFLDLVQAPGRAKAALIGCFILMTLSPAGLSAMMPFVTASFAAKTGRSMPEALLLFVAIPLLIAPFVLPIAGAWVDRWGARKVAVPATILYAAATALVPLSSGILWLFGLVIVLASIFGFMASLAVVFKVITGWFPRHRGIGFALIGTVSSLASAFLSPVFFALIGSPTAPASGLGWNGAYYVVAAWIAALAIPSAFFLLSEPDDGVSRIKSPVSAKPPTAADMRDVPGIALRKALRTRTWIFIAVSLALAAAGPMSVRQNAVGFFGERGFDAATVAVSQSVLFIASIVGLLSGGLMMDRARRPWIIVPIFAAVPLGLVLSYVNHGNLAVLFVANALLGFATGAESSLGPFLIARYFGLKCFAQIQGLTLAISTLFLGLSPFLVSAMQMATGSYLVPFAALTVLTALAAVLAIFLPAYPSEWIHPGRPYRPTVPAAPEDFVRGH
ncbi:MULTISPECIES: MFS transporter [unclassified Variovorax]|uniref:MFS transporter n=1 Tax=unclassified Variovorax TaxID=663243 RepID=UPI003F4543AD